MNKELFNLDLEEYIIGCLLIEPDRAIDFSISDFYANSSLKIYKAVRLLLEGKKHVDVINVSEITGISLEELIRLTEKVITLQSFESHKKTLKDLSEKRKLINIGNRLLKDTPNIEDVDTFKTDILKAFETEKENIKTLYVSEYLSQFIEDVFDETKRKKPIPTGFLKLNNLLGGGIYAGLYVVGGISSLGKTSIVLQIADFIAGRGKDVLFFSLEMSKIELVAKSLSRIVFSISNGKSRASTRDILDGISKEILPEFKTALEEYSKTAQNTAIY
jgi:replicative DNA helicase